MHMANELLSVPVAAGTLAIAAAGLSIICRKARQLITQDKIALMGIMGAFVFAAQMVNFQLPAMPGTSGHMIGAVLLAIILGPHAAAIVISSVVIIQCLIFQDGGLLALGCNIINMALVPAYLGYYLYRAFTAGPFSNLRTYIATLLACVVALEIGAILVVIQAMLSGVLMVPFATFLITMLGVHFLVGLMEGCITVAVLGYIQQVRNHATNYRTSSGSHGYIHLPGCITKILHDQKVFVIAHLGDHTKFIIDTLFNFVIQGGIFFLC